MLASPKTYSDPVEQRNFLRNAWYVISDSAGVSREPRSIRVCDEKLVTYRTEAGLVVVLQDRCPHRLVPLSKGRVVGDSIQCAYHGITFDCRGRCVHIPGDARSVERIPQEFDVPAFPVRERHGFVWVWLGEHSGSEIAPLPPYTEYLDDLSWESIRGYQHTKADVALIIDNLLDLSHEAFLHPMTIGNAAVGESPAKTQLLERSIEVERVMPASPPPAMFKKIAGFTGDIDRYQRVIFTPPSAFCIVVRAEPAEGSQGDKLEWYVHHLLTPESKVSTHYFYAITRNFAIGDEEVAKTLAQGSQRILSEDHAMLEAQQLQLEDVSIESRRLHTAFDGAPTAGRKLIQALLNEERESART